MAITHIAPLLEKKIAELNKKIDSKILRGKPYREEAREHRALTARLRSLRSAARHSFMSQSFSFLHLF